MPISIITDKPNELLAAIKKEIASKLYTKASFRMGNHPMPGHHIRRTLE